MQKLARGSAVVIFVSLLMLSGMSVLAQDIVSLQCGDVVEWELVQAEAVEFERTYVDRYSNDFLLDIQAGTHINLTISPLGRTFNVAFALLDSSENDVLGVNEVSQGEAEVLNDFQLSSSKQILRVVGARPDSVRPEKGIYVYPSDAGLYFGAYEIRLGCTLRDGTVIEPGESAEAPPDGQFQLAPPAFSGYGFPGLTPVDFATAFRLPLTLGTASAGEIPPAGNAILGFYFAGEAGDTLDIAFERGSGNLNLGLVLLSADNQVAYMAALVTSQTMTTRLSLPASGEYTIGIFRLDLIPPGAAEPTRFNLTGTLNP